MEKTQSNPFSDEELMEKVKKGSIGAFDILVTRYKDKILNFIYRQCGNKEEANDILQETFIKLYRKASKFKRGSKFSPWIYSISLNTARDHFKYIKRHPFEPLEGKSELIRDGSVSAEENMEKEELERKVKEAVTGLPQIYREVLVMCRYQGLELSEAAKILSCPEGTVKSRLHNAYKHLKTALLEEKPQ